MAKIIADSSCDLVSNKDMNFEIIPLLIYNDEEQFLDDGSIDIANMLDTFENYSGRSYTSCPGTESWLNAFEGEDEIYVVTITSGLSGTYNSACIAKDMFLESHPDAKIEIFDSLSTGPEMRMAVEKIAELKAKGLAFEEVCQSVHKYLDDVKLFFVLKSIRNLAQNGRVSKLIASAIGVIGISILGIASEIGTIKAIGKARGDKRIVSNFMEELEKIGYKGGNIHICNVQNEGLAGMISEAVKKKYNDVKVTIYPAGGLCSYYAERKGIIIGVEA